MKGLKNPTQRFFVTLVGLILLFTPIIAACGGGSSTATSNVAAPTPTPTQVVTVATPNGNLSPGAAATCTPADTFRTNFTDSAGTNYTVSIQLGDYNCLDKEIGFLITISEPIQSGSYGYIFDKPSSSEALATIPLIKPGTIPLNQQGGQMYGGQPIGSTADNPDGYSIDVTFSYSTIDKVVLNIKGSPPTELQKQ